MMVPVHAPRFEIDECNNELERQFIELMHARCEAGGWFVDVWPRDDRFMLSCSPVDEEENLVLRTLRIDFDGRAVSFGPDETHQFATDLDPARPDVSVISGLPTDVMVNAAADWLEREMSRPIVRQEWHQAGRVSKRWVLADTNEVVVARTQNTYAGPPDRTVFVSGHTEESR